jgi:formylglycine-generating enzyme required for sulfatase activity
MSAALETLLVTSKTKVDLKALFQVHVAAIAAAQQPLTVLADRYRAALQKQQDVAQASGDLRGVLAADAALAELDAGVEAAKPPRDTNVSRLRDIYHKEHMALVGPKQLKIRDAENDLRRRLEKLMADLTKLGLIDDAKMVMWILDKFSEERKIPKATILPTPTSDTYTRVPSPSVFVLIPAGSFQMGDVFGEGSSVEPPVHKVNVSAFFLQARETTKSEWDEVLTWALANGYTFDNLGRGKAPDHPVIYVSWYDVVKWCNARSQKEGLVPCYYADAARTLVYKRGRTELTNERVLWSASGYRLPTEAEWEKAARGGLNGKRFPWGDTISHSQVNYESDSAYAYDISPTRGFHPTYAVGNQPYSSPVGSFAANGYGLYDMVGNVNEWCWCWDWSGTYAVGAQNNPKWVASGSSRVYRGGSWFDSAFNCRVSYRRRNAPSNMNNCIGFRPARGR